MGTDGSKIYDEVGMFNCYERFKVDRRAHYWRRSLDGREVEFSEIGDKGERGFVEAVLWG